MVPRGFGLENKIFEKAHKQTIQELSDILKADDRVFTPEVSQQFQKATKDFDNKVWARSYIGVNFEGMLMPEDLDMVQEFFVRRNYRFINVISTEYHSPNSNYKTNGIMVRFIKDREF